MARLFAIAVAFACLCALTVSAQDKPAGTDQPSRYVWYSVDQVTNGKYDVYNKVTAQYREAAGSVAPDMHWIAGSSITGNSGEVTVVTFHDSMASVEKMMTAFEKIEKTISLKNASFTAQEAEATTGSHFVLAEYKQELSYRPEMVPMANTTWWSAELVNLKPGCQYEFQDAVKQAAELHTKAGDNDHWIGYRVLAGAPLPTILFVSPLRSLADEDEEPSAAAKEVLQSPMARQMFSHISKECIAHVESTYQRVEPSLSRPPQALLAANPEFWTIKEEPTATATAPKKGKAKKGMVEPTAMKEDVKK
jgi:hypothetical protein